MLGENRLTFQPYQPNTQMECVRRFMAALGGHKAGGLQHLMTPDVRLFFSCQGRHLQTGDADSVSAFLESERVRWRQPRIDIKGWQTEAETIAVRFHVQRGDDIYSDYFEYQVVFAFGDGRIQTIDMRCDD